MCGVSSEAMTKERFLSMYPDFMHRFSHMGFDLQNFIINDLKLISLFKQRESICTEVDNDDEIERNSEDVEDQVNALIEEYNEEH
ncbi:hypothetical protein [Companilactobacillus mishanensis]|uniref:Uncharacterized protein n=1 Tax=Companilactobacillus mishanensis TaxID=2486008 RepID=A0A5P0ZHB3_9LACO|nr:hypothetical protein [Companilactobacillus mishanensis]MQS44871.1 hypothetical protein [Companilactobacillus mishanensis]MQS52450.1 hypothetical protein [Companilactobacillus mishanensis]MQS89386.1 hypothetical protein [Companilactobacillus mishanensis]